MVTALDPFRRLETFGVKEEGNLSLDNTDISSDLDINNHLVEGKTGLVISENCTRFLHFSIDSFTGKRPVLHLEGPVTPCFFPSHRTSLQSFYFMST